MSALATPAAVKPSTFIDYFGVPVTGDGKVLALAPGAPCRWCCHWSLPLTLGPRPTTHGVPLTYVEWLIYAWHIQHHQGGVPLA